MKEILIIVVISIGILTFMGYVNNNFKEQCRAKGGVPVIGQHDNTCLASGVAIEID